MKEKVIFDTNIIRNAEAKTFLGGRNELERFADVADIVIPDIVIQEIKRQKRKNLQSNKQKFLDNPFHNLLEIDESNTNAFNVDDYIEKLVNDEDFTYEIIDIKDNNILPQIKDLAVNKKPPFEGKDNTDKGFKDALLYFSVLEYLQEIPNKNVFVCVKDGRLKEALDVHHNITVVESYEEFQQKSVSQFFDDYFIEKVNEFLSFKITKDNIIRFWMNINDNQVVLINKDDDIYLVEVDAEEIIGAAILDEYLPIIDRLVESPNFGITHDCIAYLNDYITFFEEDQINRILDASHENDQIRWIITDDAVKQFVGFLYGNTEVIINKETLQFLKTNFD
ncbi:PIN domain-containing protein [Maribacter sp. 2-571]|uniref:PIN domain-containing protein n=1 Tax=Maribacter sp. 2-571 TaxID=3417569 RepID=UPI003D328541